MNRKGLDVENDRRICLSIADTEDLCSIASLFGLNSNNGTKSKIEDANIYSSFQKSE